MPISIPTYKVVRVTAKIGVLIYCHSRNIALPVAQKEVLPLALSSATALVTGGNKTNKHL